MACEEFFPNITFLHAINVPEPWTYFFRVSSLAYPNLLGKKGYIVVVVVVDLLQGFEMTKQGNQSINTHGSRCNQAFQTRCKSNYNWVEPNYISWDPMMQDTTGQARSTWQHTVVTTKVGVFYSAIASTSMCRSKVLVKKCSLINLSKIWGMCCHLLRLGHPWTLLLSFWKKKNFCSLWDPTIYHYLLLSLEFL